MVESFKDKIVTGGFGLFALWLAWISYEVVTIKGGLQEEIGRSEEIDKTQESRITENTKRGLLTADRVTRVEVKQGFHHHGQ